LNVITEWLQREQPELLFLQETKVQDKDFPAKAFTAAGYHVCYRGQKSYNGVAIISRHPLKDIRPNLYDRKDQDARFISASIFDFHVVNIYVPQGFAVGSKKFEFKLNWLRDLLSHIRRSYHPEDALILAGDINIALQPIDVYDPERYDGTVGYHPEERSLLQEFLDWGMVDVFRRHHPEGGHYTFWDYRIPNAFKRKMGWRIDYILTTKTVSEKSREAWIDTKQRTLEKPSDHTFLVTEFDLEF
jgi:exodeoxyribonuclease-3